MKPVRIPTHLTQGPSSSSAGNCVASRYPLTEHTTTSSKRRIVWATFILSSPPFSRGMLKRPISVSPEHSANTQPADSGMLVETHLLDAENSEDILFHVCLVNMLGNRYFFEEQISRRVYHLSLAKGKLFVLATRT